MGNKDGRASFRNLNITTEDKLRIFLSLQMASEANVEQPHTNLTTAPRERGGAGGAFIHVDQSYSMDKDGHGRITELDSWCPSTIEANLMSGEFSPTGDGSVLSDTMVPRTSARLQCKDTRMTARGFKQHGPTATTALSTAGVPWTASLSDFSGHENVLSPDPVTRGDDSLAASQDQNMSKTSHCCSLKEYQDDLLYLELLNTRHSRFVDNRG